MSRLIDADAIPYTMLYKENWLKGTGVEKPGVWKDTIDAMPTVEPERKKGKWIMKYKGSAVTSYKCSECGRTVRDDTGYDVSKDYPFCHCGADMRGDDDD